MDFVRVGYFIPLNGPLNGHPPSIVQWQPPDGGRLASGFVPSIAIKYFISFILALVKKRCYCTLFLQRTYSVMHDVLPLRESDDRTGCCIHFQEVVSELDVKYMLYLCHCLLQQHKYALSVVCYTSLIYIINSS